MRSVPASWVAIFGFYGLSLRTPDLVPGQVQLLRTLLAQAGEANVETVDPRRRSRWDLHPEGDAPAVGHAQAMTGVTPARDDPTRRVAACRSSLGSGSLAETHRIEGDDRVFLPLAGLLVGVLAGLVLNVNVSFEFSRYSAVAILAALDSVLGAVRAELDGVYDNRIFISGFLTNAIVAVILTFIGDRLSLDLYLVALINFGFRIFNNVALIRRHFV